MPDPRKTSQTDRVGRALRPTLLCLLAVGFCLLSSGNTLSAATPKPNV